MNKEIVEDHLRPRRKSSFSKTKTINKFIEDVKLPNLQISEAKTVKRFSNNNVQIPFLNMDNLQDRRLHKNDTLHFKQTKPILTERSKTPLNLMENSFTCENGGS